MTLFFFIFKSNTFGCAYCHDAAVYTKIWKKMLQGLESSQDHVTNELVACRSETTDSDAEIGIGFPQIAPADNNKGYDSAPGQNMLDSAKRERLESKLS